MRVLGIDMGSREVKIIMMEDHKIIFRKKVSTMSFYRDYCSYNQKIIVDVDKLECGTFDIGISTGYGKNNTDLNTFKSINEIKAHAYGAMHQLKKQDFLLLDIGGQDVKVIKVEKGVVVDLDLNDKCAASCGRYLENMASVLEVNMEELESHHENPVPLNSTCAVFSESELIGKIAEGVSTETLCASVNYSLYKRLKPLLNTFSSKNLVLSGGVSKNKAIQKYLMADYTEVICVEEPQFNGAIGCCVYGSR
ncbi:MAG: 2-hydroxyglutaryl-CoA dehydratase [Clostridia bacterium]|nr:2-hydroxyglutaryl-CoA dehydratase [Clostridia bacterium]